MAVVAIEENEIDLIDQLRRVGDIYSYFENVNGVSSFSEIESDDGAVQSEITPGIIKEPTIEPEVIKYEESLLLIDLSINVSYVPLRSHKATTYLALDESEQIGECCCTNN